MQLDSTFAVDAPIEAVWLTLMDFEKVAGCVPGAQILSRLSEDAYQVGMKVKLGPISMQYRGQMEVIERDAAGHRAVVSGSAKEARGQGTAQATATLSLVEEAGTTRGSVSAEVALSGRAAAMGQSVIGAVTDQMMAQFAQNLQAMLNAGGGAAPGESREGEDAAAPVLSGGAAQGVAAGGAGAAAGVTAPVEDPEPVAAAWAAESSHATAAPAAPVAPHPTVPARPAAATPRASAPGLPATDSLNALTLALGMARAQLGNPRTVALIVAGVAVVSYKVGQLTTRRERARWLGA